MTARVLVDTSGWTAFLKGSAPDVLALQREGIAVAHPLVAAELLLGGAEPDRLLAGLDWLPEAGAGATMAWVRRQPRGALRGLGYVDVALLVSALDAGVELFTLDRRLAAAYAAAKAA
jgi:hypothetical protein